MLGRVREDTKRGHRVDVSHTPYSLSSYCYPKHILSLVGILKFA